MREKHGPQQSNDAASPVFKKRFARRVTTQRPFRFVRNIESQRTAESQVVEQVGSRGLVISSPVRLGTSITDIVQQSPVPVIISCAVDCELANVKTNVKAGYRADSVSVSTPRRSQRCHESSAGFRSRLQYPVTDYKLTKFHCTSDKRYIGSQPDSNIDEEVHFVDCEQSGKNCHSVRQKGKTTVHRKTTVVGNSSAASITAEESSKAPSAGLSALADVGSASKRSRTRRSTAAEGSAECTVHAASAVFDNIVDRMTRPDASVLAIGQNRVNTQWSEVTDVSCHRKRSRRLSLTDKSAREDDTQTDEQGDTSSQVSVATDRSGCVWRRELPSGVDSYRVHATPQSCGVNVGGDVISKQHKSPVNVSSKTQSRGLRTPDTNTPRRKCSHKMDGLAPVNAQAKEKDKMKKCLDKLQKPPPSSVVQPRMRKSQQASVSVSVGVVASEAFEEGRQAGVAEDKQTIHLGRRKRKQVSPDNLPQKEQDSASGSWLGSHGNIDTTSFQSLTKQGNALSESSVSTSVLKTSAKQTACDHSISASTDRRKRQNNNSIDGVLPSAKRKKAVKVSGISVPMVTDSIVMQHKLATNISGSAVTLVPRCQARGHESEGSASTSWLRRKSDRLSKVDEKRLQQRPTSLSSVYDDQTFGEDSNFEVDSSDEKRSRTKKPASKAAQWFHTEQVLAQVHKGQGDSVASMLVDTEMEVISDLFNASTDLKRTVHEAFNFVTRQMLHMMSQQKEVLQLKTDVHKLKAKVRNVSMGSRAIHQQKCQLLKDLQALKRDGLDADAVRIESWLNDFQKFRRKCCGSSA